MKAAPVIRSLAALGAPPTLVHTGQHYDERMSEVFFNELGMPAPDLNLGIGGGSHGTQTAELLRALEELFVERSPNRVVVYGDINSTLAATLAASKLSVPVAHVEAGLRSFDRSMPEEVNRVVTDALSSTHFVTSPEAIGHLAREGVAADGVHFVGNPMIDTLLRFRGQLDGDAARRELRLPERFGIVTLHRPANVDIPEVAKEIVSGLAAVASELPLVVPLHPRGAKVLADAGLHAAKGIVVVEPLGYLTFMALVSAASLVLTDSGGIQEETTILGVPCLTLRDNTERPVTITHGTNRLVPRNATAISEAAADALTSETQGVTPPLWDGRAGDRIAEVLVTTGRGSVTYH